MFSKNLKSCRVYGFIFERKFVTKNFENSPNLVTWFWLSFSFFLSFSPFLSISLSFFLSFFISLPFCLSHFFFSIPFICTWTWATKFQFIFWILCRLLDRDVPIFKIFANFLPHRFVCSKMATNDMFLFGRKWYFKTFLKMCHPLPLFRLFSSFRTNSTISYNK